MTKTKRSNKSNEASGSPRLYQVHVQMVVNCGVWVDVMASSQDEADAAAIDWIYDEKNAAEIEEREHCAHDEWEVDKSYRCLDCGVDTLDIGEFSTMLSEEIWRSIVPDGEGMLCLAHMEARLGRPLEDDDFMPGVPRGASA